MINLWNGAEYILLSKADLILIMGRENALSVIDGHTIRGMYRIY